MSERKPCQCGSIDFTGEDESQAYETPRAFHWFDKPCEAKPQPPTTKAELRAALFSATERAERAERERDEARADHLRVRDECFATMEALADERKALDATEAALSSARELSEARYVEACNQAQRAVEMEAERDAARSEVEALRKEILDVHDALHRECSGPVDLPGEIRALRSRASAAESDRASLEERLDAALARLHETREHARELEAAVRDECALLRAWARESREGGWSTHQVDPMKRRAADLADLLALAPSPSTTPETRGDDDEGKENEP